MVPSAWPKRAASGFERASPLGPFWVSDRNCVERGGESRDERVRQQAFGGGICVHSTARVRRAYIEEDGIGSALVLDKGLEHTRQELQVDALLVGVVGMLPRVRDADHSQAVGMFSAFGQPLDGVEAEEGGLR